MNLKKKKMDNVANASLVGGAFFLAGFYQFLAHFKIETAQVETLVIVFTFSGLIGIAKAVVLRHSVRDYMFYDLLSKLFLFLIPFILAVIAKQIPAFYYLVDYVFSFLTIGEFIAILINIQCIRKRKHIEELDFYNILIEKFKKWAHRYLRLDDARLHGLPPRDKPYKDEEFLDKKSLYEKSELEKKPENNLKDTQ